MPIGALTYRSIYHICNFYATYFLFFVSISSHDPMLTIKYKCLWQIYTVFLPRENQLKNERTKVHFVCFAMAKCPEKGANTSLNAVSFLTLRNIFEVYFDFCHF